MTELTADSYRTLGRSDSIPNDFVTAFYLDDPKARIAVARVRNALYAFDDLCPCSTDSCPLSFGLLLGTTIMCQCHGSKFDITTGAVVAGPAAKALTMHTVREIEEAVQIAVESANHAHDAKE